MDYSFAKKYDLVSRILSDKLRIHETFPLCMCEPNTFEKMLKKGQVITTCHVHKRNGLIFDTDGSVLLCNHLAGYGAGKYGVDFHDSTTFLVRRVMNRTFVETYNRYRPYIEYRRKITSSKICSHFDRVANTWENIPVSYPYRTVPSAKKHRQVNS